jgi:type IV secretory pathway TrbD component
MHIRALLLAAAGIGSFAAAAITPTAAPAPRVGHGPMPIKLKMPPAKALPAATVTIALPKRDRTDDLTLVATNDAVWTARGPFRIAARKSAVTGPFALGRLQDVGAGFGSVWVSYFYADLVRRLDAKTGATQALIHLPANSGPEGVAIADGTVWVANHYAGTVVRIDPKTNKPVKKIRVTYTGRSGPQGIAAGLGSVWVGVPNRQSVVRIDPRTNRIAAVIPVPRSANPCGGIAVTAAAVWVTSCSELRTVARIDPRTNKVASILDVGGYVWQPAAQGNMVWLVASGSPHNSPTGAAYLLRLRANDKVGTRIKLDKRFFTGGATVAFGSIWIADWNHPRVLRIPNRR